MKTGSRSRTTAWAIKLKDINWHGSSGITARFGVMMIMISKRWRGIGKHDWARLRMWETNADMVILIWNEYPVICQVQELQLMVLCWLLCNSCGLEELHHLADMGMHKNALYSAATLLTRLSFCKGIEIDNQGSEELHNRTERFVVRLQETAISDVLLYTTVLQMQGVFRSAVKWALLMQTYSGRLTDSRIR
jgi:hypothetical protein